MSGIFDIQVKPQKPEVKSEDTGNSDRFLKVHMPDAPDGEMVYVGPDQVKRVYEDGVGSRLLLVVDEVAELLMPTGVKTEAGKAEDALKQEIQMLIQSLTQLGRSAGVHLILATQRNYTTIITGVIKSKCLSLDTKIRVRREI